MQKGDESMRPYRLAVCEDDKIVRDGICTFCGQTLTEEKISHEVAGFSSAEALEQAIKQEGQKFDLLILDILLEKKTGMELALDIRKWDEKVSILFITGYEEYIGKGYDVHAVHFLLKPLNWTKFKQILLEDWKKRHRPDTLVLQKGRSSLRIPLQEILYAEADKNHAVRFILTEGEEKFPISLSELEQMEPGGQLIRCHNSYLVNMDHVRRLEKQDFFLDNGKKVPVSRKYLKQCQEKILSYFTQ